MPSDRPQAAHEREPPLIRVAAYFPEDFDAIRPINRPALGDLEALKHLIIPEYSRTGFHVDRPVIAAGAVPMWEGVGHGWVLIDEDVPPLPALMQAMREGLQDVMRNTPFHRVQAEVQREFQKGRTFLTLLGFQYEGPLEAYGRDGSDYDRFAFIDRSLVT